MGLPIYNKLKEKGFIMAPYGLIRTTSETIVIVLMELLAELNYAQNNGLNFGNDFLCNINRLSEVLNIELSYLLEILKELQELDFIVAIDSDIEDTKCITVKLNNIINYIETNDRNNFINWNDGLKISLNPINERLNFNQSTLKIKDYLDSNLQILDAIPLIYYLYLNRVIENYENHFGNIFEDINVFELIQEAALSKNSDSDSIRAGFIAIMQDLNNQALRVN